MRDKHAFLDQLTGDQPANTASQIADVAQRSQIRRLQSRVEGRRLPRGDENLFWRLAPQPHPIVRGGQRQTNATVSGQQCFQFLPQRPGEEIGDLEVAQGNNGIRPSHYLILIRYSSWLQVKKEKTGGTLSTFNNGANGL